MVKILTHTLTLVILTWSSTIGNAQISTEGPRVAITPRTRPDGAGLATGLPEIHLQVETSLVLIPVQATSLMGASITDLAQNNFRIFEDGVEQTITTFSKDDAPLSVGLVFDASASMANKIHKSAEAAAAFFRTANQSDEFFLVEFGEKPKLTLPFTSDSETIYRRLVHSKPYGRTSLIDAIHLALLQMKKARNSRKAIVILSDGGDNRSRLTPTEIKNALVESDVQTYAMGIFDPEDVARHSREEEYGPRLLNELVSQTGGHLYTVEHLDELASIGTLLGNAIRNQYLLGYIPSHRSRDGKYRHVKVDLAVSSELPPGVSVSYRHGYYAPEQ